MQHKFFQSIATTIFITCLFFVSQGSVQAGPGNLGQTPLFVAPPVAPNIFFMLDDSGSMNWTMPSDGVGSESIVYLGYYHTRPDQTIYGGQDVTKEWNTWCLGGNLMAYDPAITYTPWAADMPATTTPFPDQTDLANVWVDPATQGTGSAFYESGENSYLLGNDGGTIDLSGAPVVTWTDDDTDGAYDVGECPTSYADARSRVVRADTLSATQQINFANWFSYYRLREHATKSAVTQVISNSSARMGVSTLHNNNGVGIGIKEMNVAANKKALLDDVIQISSSGGTPLRRSLDDVGRYFNQGTGTPGSLNISTAGIDKPIVTLANGGECQQNFTMLMTDGQWNGGVAPGIVNEDSPADNSLIYPAHEDAKSDTLADIAMKWYKTDLALGLLPKVPIQVGNNAVNLDENAQQHMVTFGVAFGPTGTLTSNPADRTAAFAWPTPLPNSVETVDDLRHAAYNGRGQFLSANDPQSLITSLQTVISDIESRQGSAAAVSFNTTSLIAGSAVFFASFDTTGWKGDVRALTIDPVTGVIDTSTSLWRAAPLLDARLNADMASRPIYTWGTDSAATNNGVLFNWSTVNPQPATIVADDFKANQDGSVDIAPFTATQTRLNFIRGDTSQDGVGLIRDRASRLGDIVHSSPHFVGRPISNWPDSSLNGSPFGSYATPYSSYQSTQQLSPRTGMVYVGANDGMLHGFNASTGAEVFAYVPSAPASSANNDGIHYLTESDYQHRYYVDGSTVSSDVFMRTEPLGTLDWHTVLVGSLRGGGQGLYALDVTDPSQFLNTDAAAQSSIMWEFTNQDDADLGYTFSDPQVTMMNNGEWAVVIGNGYNATGTNTAKLMIIYIDKGVDGHWAVTDYKKIDTGVGTGLNQNGLSTPALVDLDENGTTDRIYAGDLYGNMWAFDVSNASDANWQIAHQDALANKIPLFTATHHAGNPPAQVLATPTPQQITFKPLVIKPDATTQPGLMIYFGTGQYVATGDASNADQQTYYGIRDTNISPPAGTVASVLASNLVEQTFRAGFPPGARVLTTHSQPTTSLGWFINLPEPKERVVVEAFEIAGLIFFNTMTPSSAPCSAGGESWLMAVERLTGGNPLIAAFDINGDRVLDNGDLISDGTESVYAAGVSFGYGIASATAVIRNADGFAFGVVSGTDTQDPHDYVLPCDEDTHGCGGSTVTTGTRKSWQQLFN